MLANRGSRAGASGAAGGLGGNWPSEQQLQSSVQDFASRLGL